MTVMLAMRSVGKVVALAQVGGRVVAEGDGAVASSAMRSLSGRSMAMLGDGKHERRAGVGFPKMTTLVFGMLRPAAAASPLWSMMAKSLTPFVSEQRGEARQDLIDRVMREDADKARGRGGGHGVTSRRFRLIIAAVPSKGQESNDGRAKDDSSIAGRDQSLISRHNWLITSSLLWNR